MKDMMIFLGLVGVFVIGHFVMLKVGHFLDKSFHEERKEENDYGQASQERVEYGKALLESRQKPSWQERPDAPSGRRKRAWPCRTAR